MDKPEENKTSVLTLSFKSNKKPSMKTWNIGFYSFFLNVISESDPELSKRIHDTNSFGISFSEPVMKSGYFVFNVSSDDSVISKFLYSFVTKFNFSLKIGKELYQCIGTDKKDVSAYSGQVLMQTGVSLGKYTFEEVKAMKIDDMSKLLKEVTFKRFASMYPEIKMTDSINIYFNESYINNKKENNNFDYIHNVSIKNGGVSSVRSPIVLEGKGKTAKMFFEFCHAYGVGCRTNLGLGCTYPNRPKPSSNRGV